MIYTEMTKKAMVLCFEKHKNQTDKCGVPYPFHPFHVAESMTDEITTCVALLHDVIEDTDTTPEQLKALGFPDAVVDAVVWMTHKEGVPYMTYIKRIKDNDVARRVKLSDLAHNSDLSRLTNVTEKDLKRVEKYKTAIDILLS